MEMLAPGTPAPDFCLPDADGTEICLQNFREKWIVLYFYPRDNTPGCTLEGQEFRDLCGTFKESGTEILGVSRDSLTSHEKFRDKQNFPFHLISDTDETLCNLFDVIKDKNMYGKKMRSIERSTFLIDSKGVLRQEWRKVKPKGHAAEVLEAVKLVR